MLTPDVTHISTSFYNCNLIQGNMLLQPLPKIENLVRWLQLQFSIIFHLIDFHYKNICYVSNNRGKFFVWNIGDTYFLKAMTANIKYIYFILNINIWIAKNVSNKKIIAFEARKKIFINKQIRVLQTVCMFVYFIMDNLARNWKKK